MIDISRRRFLQALVVSAAAAGVPHVAQGLTIKAKAQAWPSRLFEVHSMQDYDFMMIGRFLDVHGVPIDGGLYRCGKNRVNAPYGPMWAVCAEYAKRELIVLDRNEAQRYRLIHWKREGRTHG